MIAFTNALRRAYSPVEALPNELLAQGSRTLAQAEKLTPESSSLLSGRRNSNHRRSYALRAREHVEGDRHVFARHRGDRKHMKELVIPEDLRVRVGSAPCIDDGACGIEDPADGHK